MGLHGAEVGAAEGGDEGVFGVREARAVEGSYGACADDEDAGGHYLFVGSIQWLLREVRFDGGGVWKAASANVGGLV